MSADDALGPPPDDGLTLGVKRPGNHRDLHLSIRRQRRMCIRDSVSVETPRPDRHFP